MLTLLYSRYWLWRCTSGHWQRMMHQGLWLYCHRSFPLNFLFCSRLWYPNQNHLLCFLSSNKCIGTLKSYYGNKLYYVTYVDHASSLQKRNYVLRFHYVLMETIIQVSKLLSNSVIGRNILFLRNWEFLQIFFFLFDICTKKKIFII